MENNEERLSRLLGKSANIFFFLVPLISDKDSFLNTLIKFTPILRGNIKIVTIDNEKKEDYISYSELNARFDTLDNTFFIIYDFNILLHYGMNLISRNSTNKFLIFLNINEIKLSKKLKFLIDEGKVQKAAFFYPKNLDMPINFSGAVRKTYIIGNQLKAYLNDYIESQNYVSLDNKENTSSAKLLNVYFDEKIKTLENLSLDKCLQRAPKFKTILLDILTMNKKRHIIRMIDGKYGIDSFVTVYNKLKNNPVLIVIKKADSYDTKIRKLEIFNESNAPGVLLTDYNFSRNMIAKNIDCYHVTDGGSPDDNISFFDMCQGKNYSGTYPRNMEMISHIGVGIDEEFTIDMEKNEAFMDKYNKLLIAFDYTKKLSIPLYLKGNEFYSSKPAKIEK